MLLYIQTIWSCGMIVLHIRIMKVWDFYPKVLPTNEPNIYFMTAWQHWLGMAKPKNAFGSTLNLCIKVLWNFKNFLFNRFFYWMTDYPTDWFLQTSITRKPLRLYMGLISSLFNVTLSWDMPFCQPHQLQCLHHDSTTAYLCSPLFSIPFSTTA